MSEDSLAATVAEAVAAHPDEWARFCEGDDKLAGFFTGLVMKATSGQANGKAVAAELRRLRSGPVALLTVGAAGRGRSGAQSGTASRSAADGGPPVGQVGAGGEDPEPGDVDGPQRQVRAAGPASATAL